jgi:excisionase family DNA binding protein
MNPERTHISPQAIADQLGVQIETIRRAIKRGDLPATNIGSARRHTWRVAKSDLATWIAARTNTREKVAQ